VVKSQLITRIADKVTHLPLKAVEMCVHHILETMGDSLSAGQRVEVRDFGSFKLKYKAPRNAHNPRTGEKVATIPKYIPHFKPGKAMRERVNENYGNPLIHEDDSDD